MKKSFKNLSLIFNSTLRALKSFKILIFILICVASLISISLSTFLTVEGKFKEKDSEFLQQEDENSYGYKKSSPKDIYNLFCTDSAEVIVENGNGKKARSFNPHFSFGSANGNEGCFLDINSNSYEINYVYDYNTQRVRRVRAKTRVHKRVRHPALDPIPEVSREPSEDRAALPIVDDPDGTPLPEIERIYRKDNSSNLSQEKKKHGKNAIYYEGVESPRLTVPNSGFIFQEFPRLNLNSAYVKNSLFGRLLAAYKRTGDKKFLTAARDLYFHNYSALVDYLENQIAEETNRYLEKNRIFEFKTLEDSTLDDYISNLWNNPEIQGRYDYVTAPQTLPGMKEIASLEIETDPEDSTRSLAIDQDLIDLLRENYKKTFKFWDSVLKRLKDWSDRGFIPDLNFEGYSDDSSLQSYNPPPGFQDVWNSELFDGEGGIDEGFFEAYFVPTIIYIKKIFQEMKNRAGGDALSNLHPNTFENEEFLEIFEEFKKINGATKSFIRAIKNWVQKQSEASKKKIRIDRLISEWKREISEWNEYWGDELASGDSETIVPNYLVKPSSFSGRERLTLEDIERAINSEDSDDLSRILDEHPNLEQMISEWIEMLHNYRTFTELLTGVEDDGSGEKKYEKWNELIRDIKAKTGISLEEFISTYEKEGLRYLSERETKEFIDRNFAIIRGIERAKGTILGIVKNSVSERESFRQILNSDPQGALRQIEVWFPNEISEERRFDMNIKDYESIAITNVDYENRGDEEAANEGETFSQSRYQKTYDVEGRRHYFTPNQFLDAVDYIDLVSNERNDLFDFDYAILEESDLRLNLLGENIASLKKGLKDSLRLLPTPDDTPANKKENNEVLKAAFETKKAELDEFNFHNFWLKSYAFREYWKTYQFILEFETNWKPIYGGISGKQSENWKRTPEELNANLEIAGETKTIAEWIAKWKREVFSKLQLLIASEVSKQDFGATNLTTEKKAELDLIREQIAKIRVTELESLQTPVEVPEEDLEVENLSYEKRYLSVFFNNMYARENVRDPTAEAINCGVFDISRERQRIHDLVYSRFDLKVEDYEWSVWRMKNVLRNRRDFCLAQKNFDNPEVNMGAEGIVERANLLNDTMGHVGIFHSTKKIGSRVGSKLREFIADQTRAPENRSREIVVVKSDRINSNLKTGSKISQRMEEDLVFRKSLNSMLQNFQANVINYYKSIEMREKNIINVLLPNEYYQLKNDEKIIFSTNFFRVIGRKEAGGGDNENQETKEGFIAVQNRLFSENFKNVKKWRNRDAIYFPDPLHKVKQYSQLGRSGRLERIEKINKAAAAVNGFRVRVVWWASTYELNTNKMTLVIKQDEDTDYYLEPGGDRIREWFEVVVHPASGREKNLKVGDDPKYIGINNLKISGFGTTKPYFYSQINPILPINENNQIIFVSPRLFKNLETNVEKAIENIIYYEQTHYYLKNEVKEKESKASLDSRKENYLLAIGESVRYDDEYDAVNHLDRNLNYKVSNSAKNPEDVENTNIKGFYDSRDINSNARYNNQFYNALRKSFSISIFVLIVLLVIVLIWILFLICSKKSKEEEGGNGILMGMGLKRRYFLINYIPLLLPFISGILIGWFISFFIEKYVFIVLRQRIAFDFTAFQKFNISALFITLGVLLTGYFAVNLLIDFAIFYRVTVLELIRGVRIQKGGYWLSRLQKHILNNSFIFKKTNIKIGGIFFFASLRKIGFLILVVFFFLITIIGNYMIFNAGEETIKSRSENINYKRGFSMMGPNDNNPFTRLNPLYHEGYRKILEDDYHQDYPLDGDGIRLYRRYKENTEASRAVRNAAGTEERVEEIELRSYEDFFQYVQPFNNRNINIQNLLNIIDTLNERENTSQVVDDEESTQRKKDGVVNVCRVLVQLANLKEKRIENSEDCLNFLKTLMPPVSYEDIRDDEELFKEAIYRFSWGFGTSGFNPEVDEMITQFQARLAGHENSTESRVIGVGENSRAFKINENLKEEINKDIEIDEQGRAVVNVVVNRKFQYENPDLQVGSKFNVDVLKRRTKVDGVGFEREDWHYLEPGQSINEFIETPNEEKEEFEGLNTIVDIERDNSVRMYRGRMIGKHDSRVEVDADTGVLTDGDTGEEFDFVRKNKDILVDRGAPRYQKMIDTDRVFLNFNGEWIRPFYSDPKEDYPGIGKQGENPYRNWWSKKNQEGVITEEEEMVLAKNEDNQDYVFRVAGFVDTYNESEIVISQKNANQVMGYPKYKDSYGSYKYYNGKLNYSNELSESLYQWGIINESGYLDLGVFKGPGRDYVYNDQQLLKEEEDIVKKEINFFLKIGIISIMCSILAVFFILIFIIQNSIESLKKKMIGLKIIGYSTRFYVVQNIVIFFPPIAIAIGIAVLFVELMIKVLPFKLLGWTGIFIFFPTAFWIYIIVIAIVLAIFGAILFYNIFQFKRIRLSEAIKSNN